MSISTLSKFGNDWEYRVFQCFIQLRRPSDNATSDAVPFEFTALDTGRRSLVAFRKVKGIYEPVSRLFTIDGDITESATAPNGVITIEDDVCMKENTSSTEQLIGGSTESEDMVDSTNKTSNWLEKNEFNILNDETPKKIASNTSLSHEIYDFGAATARPIISRVHDTNALLAESETSCDDEDKTLNELLEQVAELDEIYSGYQKRNVKLDEAKFGESNEMSFDFDDTATYTSLQRAFKNPIKFNDVEPRSYDLHYDDVEPILNPMAPIIDISPLKRNDEAVEEEKLPPLPPKRLRKLTAENTEYNANMLPPSPQKDPNLLSDEPSIIIKRSPDSRSPASSTNNSTQSSPQKKPGFFSRIFRRKSKAEADLNGGTDAKSSPNLASEPSFNDFNGFDRNRLTAQSCRMPLSPTKKGKPVGRSVSSISGKRPHLAADVVHIPLKGLCSDSMAMRSGSGNILMADHYSSDFTLSNNLDRKTVSALQLADIPLQDGNMELVAIADAQSLRNLCEGQYGVKLDADVDLSEAEHFALYTSMPSDMADGTQTEFERNPAFYASVDETEVVPTTEIAKRLVLSSQPHPQ